MNTGINIGSGTLLLESLLGPPQLLTDYTTKDNQTTQIQSTVNENDLSEEFVSENVEYIQNKIILEILNTNTDEIDDVFQSKLFSFSLRLNQLNMVFLRNFTHEKNFDNQELIYNEYQLFNLISKRVESTINIPDKSIID